MGVDQSANEGVDAVAARKMKEGIATFVAVDR